jgi:hypothetical protein
MKPTTLLVFATAIGLACSRALPPSNQDTQLDARRLPTRVDVEQPARRSEAEDATFTSGGSRRDIVIEREDELPTRTSHDDEEPSRPIDADPDTFTNSPGRRKEEDELLTRDINEDEEPVRRAADTEPDEFISPNTKRRILVWDSGEPVRREEPDPDDPDEYSSPNTKRRILVWGSEDELTARSIDDDEEPVRRAVVVVDSGGSIPEGRTIAKGDEEPARRATIEARAVLKRRILEWDSNGVSPRVVVERALALGTDVAGENDV